MLDRGYDKNDIRRTIVNDSYRKDTPQYHSYIESILAGIKWTPEDELDKQMEFHRVNLYTRDYYEFVDFCTLVLAVLKANINNGGTYILASRPDVVIIINILNEGYDRIIHMILNNWVWFYCMSDMQTLFLELYSINVPVRDTILRCFDILCVGKDRFKEQHMENKNN